MTFAVRDRVKDTTTTTGTGTITLSGSPPAGFQAFSVIGNGNTCSYTIADAATGAWETGIGTYSSTGPTLARTTVLESSNSGAPVSFAAGTKDVFVSLPAGLVGYQQIGTTQSPSGVASSSITGIPDTYSDLLIMALGLSHDSGTSQFFRIELTNDGGTSWSTPTTVSVAGIAAAAGLYGRATIIGYNTDAPVVSGAIGELASDLAVLLTSAPRTIITRAIGGINGIRFSWSAGNFDAGSWKLLGRL